MNVLQETTVHSFSLLSLDCEFLKVESILFISGAPRLQFRNWNRMDIQQSFPNTSPQLNLS